MAWAAFVSVVALAGLATAPSIVDIIETGRSDARVVAIFLLLFGSMAAVATFLAPGNWDSMIRSAGRFSPARGAGGGIVTVILSYLALTVVSFFVSPPGGLAIGVGFAFVGPALLMIGAACGAVVTLQCRARLLRLRRVREQADGPADTAAITRGRACWSARLLGRPGSHSRWADGEVGARIDRAGRWAALVFGLLVAAVVWWLVPHVIGYARSGWPHTVHEFGALALTVPVMAVVAPRLWAWMAGGTSGVSVRHGVVGGILVAIAAHVVLLLAASLISSLLSARPLHSLLRQPGVMVMMGPSILGYRVYQSVLHGTWVCVVAAAIVGGLVAWWCQRRLERGQDPP